MIRDVISLLACPVCHSKMTLDDEGKVCRCLGMRTHCFDVARSGHLHLGGSHAGEGDTKDAVLARRAFLDAGYYQSLSDEINSVIGSIGAQTVLDAGCGEGYYTNRLATDRSVLGLDLSRAGIEYAAKVQRESSVVEKWNEYMKDILIMELDPVTGAQPQLKKVFSFN